jgi:hypothetical protein
MCPACHGGVGKKRRVAAKVVGRTVHVATTQCCAA